MTDESFLSGCGIKAEPLPEPMVSGERWSALRDNNDYLTQRICSLEYRIEAAKRDHKWKAIALFVFGVLYGAAFMALGMWWASK